MVTYAGAYLRALKQAGSACGSPAILQLHRGAGSSRRRALKRGSSASDREAEAAAAGLLVGAVGLVRGELDVRLAQARVLGVPSLAAPQLLDVGHCLQCNNDSLQTISYNRRNPTGSCTSAVHLAMITTSSSSQLLYI